MIKKPKWFFNEKTFLKILTFCGLKRNFFNFLQDITFDTFVLSTYVLYWEYYRKIKTQTVIE